MKFIKLYKNFEKFNIKGYTKNTLNYYFNNLRGNTAVTENNMIKKYLQYIKENSDVNIEDFKIGDIVTCIDNEDIWSSLLTFNKSYQVENIKNCVNVQLKLVGLDYYWYSSRFIHSTPEEIKDFEIKNTAEKYNL